MYARKQSKWVKISKTYGHSVQVDMYGATVSSSGHSEVFGPQWGARATLSSSGHSEQFRPRWGVRATVRCSVSSSGHSEQFRPRWGVRATVRCSGHSEVFGPRWAVQATVKLLWPNFPPPRYMRHRHKTENWQWYYWNYCCELMHTKHVNKNVPYLTCQKATDISKRVGKNWCWNNVCFCKI